LNQVLEQMKQSKEPWDAITYHSLIVAYGCCGLTDKMLEVLEDMKRNKFTPMEQTYRAVLYGIARNATPEQLFQYYNDYLRQGHVQPSEKLYVSLMNAKWVTHDANTMIEIFDMGVVISSSI
jgi:pentatricopeptide repeat protein